MTAVELPQMRAEIASLCTEEWGRRRLKDSSLEARVYTAQDIMDLEAMEGVSYVNSWSYTPFNPAEVKVAPGLNEPSFAVTSAADACHVKAGAMGTLYLVGYPDCNRNNRIRHIEFHASPECRAGWDSCFQGAVLSEPAMVYHAVVPAMIAGEEDMLSLPVCVCDGDKGLAEAMKSMNVPGFRCTNHRAANMQVKHGVQAAEAYKMMARAPSVALFEQSASRLAPAALAFAKQMPSADWAVAHHPVLVEGGSLDTQTTNNVGEQLNNALDGARRMATPLGSLHAVVQHEQRRFLEIQAEAHACMNPLPPRPAADLAKALARVKGFKPGSVQWLDGNVRMKGRVTKRSDAESSVVCRLIRVGDNRVECECECGYSRRDGMGCDHGMLLAQQGGKAHTTELVPFRMTTEAWKLQYPLTYVPGMPNDSDMADAVDGAGAVVRAEAGLAALGQVQLMAVLAMKRQRGRPTKDSFKRMDPHAVKTAASKERPTLNAVGDLAMIRKNKCGKCGQVGHTSLKCQGRGYIASLVDMEVTKEYQRRKELDDDAQPAPQQRGTGKRPAAPPQLKAAPAKKRKTKVVLSSDSEDPEQPLNEVQLKGYASSFAELHQQQMDTLDEVNQAVTCFGPECDRSIGVKGTHRCSWCNRVMHVFCGVADPDQEEGHGQAVDCKTPDCIGLRPKTGKFLI